MLGPIPRTLLHEDPISQIPLHAKPMSKYYYTSHVEKVIAHLRNQTTVVYPLTNFPIMFDSGSNYSDFPKVNRRDIIGKSTWPISHIFPHTSRKATGLF